MVKIVKVLVQPREEHLKVGEFVDLQIKELMLVLLFPGISWNCFFLTLDIMFCPVCPKLCHPSSTNFSVEYEKQRKSN